MGYSYEYFYETCVYLKKNGFKPKNILDIGANICETADICRLVWPVSNILLIEANKNCEYLYKQKNYNYLIRLLGSYNGECAFYKTKVSETNSGNSIYKENSDSYKENNLIIENLPIYKLDNCINERYDFIKIDTQGSELDIINGGINTISNSKVVIVEVSLVEYNLGGCKKKDVVESLTKLNFDYISTIEVIWDKNSNLIGESLMFIKP